MSEVKIVFSRVPALADSDGTSPVRCKEVWIDDKKIICHSIKIEADAGVGLGVAFVTIKMRPSKLELIGLESDCIVNDPIIVD